LSEVSGAIGDFDGPTARAPPERLPESIGFFYLATFG
jgi:hypothetical protein